MYKKIQQTEDFKAISREEVEEAAYQFDGADLCAAIRTICNRFG